ncbi:hypothetical protein DICPUDRAFT_155076 [Dictyostelium purpureum]|uniref:Uncharacterized protein n=1 Tax=Dictyostelium purpureum TaxID=5786 RepID=F0ZT08_DICPU|nr:uncharacterized protein DICPUDRAFT_155076 [Dictyostelium purpureum]EGC32914.1 hypothetical protein DICPUDRAFT_155076 [Dictyostelium purpureum]|eukprot:XP_003290562.1 hypothetical protein DICPUDRAFT_155076 [Dictyostelium purpureum]
MSYTKVKVKTVNSKKCLGFEGFNKRHYPSPLEPIMGKEEFEQVVNRINTVTKTRYSKTFFIPLLIIFLGICLIFIGLFKGQFGVTGYGIGFAGIGTIVLAVMIFLFQRKIKKNIETSLKEANAYFADRRISFTLVEKHGKPRMVKSGTKERVERRHKIYIEISFPTPGVEHTVAGAIGGFISNILPGGNNSGLSFGFTPNVNVGGYDVQAPQVNVKPQFSESGRPEFVFSVPSVSNDFNISIDAADATKKLLDHANDYS